MPTVMQVSGYRFFFDSLEGLEPPHIHVERDCFTAKYWLSPSDWRGTGDPLAGCG